MHVIVPVYIALKFLWMFEIPCPHRCVDDNSGLLGYDTMSLSEKFLIFQRTVVLFLDHLPLKVWQSYKMSVSTHPVIQRYIPQDFQMQCSSVFHNSPILSWIWHRATWRHVFRYTNSLFQKKNHLTQVLLHYMPKILRASVFGINAQYVQGPLVSSREKTDRK